ncbi:MAG: hypothetical protein AAF368_17170, partial [Planctomycetota bacterium]
MPSLRSLRPASQILPTLRALCASAALALTSVAAAPHALAQGGPPTPTHADLVYATVGGSELALDLYLPSCSNLGAPLVVFVHGGGWFDGDKFPING